VWCLKKKYFCIMEKSFRKKPEELFDEVSRILDEHGGPLIKNRPELEIAIAKLIREDDTLENAKEWAREKMREKAISCPLCAQTIKMYERKFTSSQAAFLLRMAFLVGFDTSIEIHYSEVNDKLGFCCNEYGSIGRWGLIEKCLEKRADGNSNGFWHLTNEGVLFAKGESRISGTIMIYNDRRYAFGGDLIYIKDALGDRFDYDELMSDIKFAPINKKKLLTEK